jgi:copper transport protein
MRVIRWVVLGLLALSIAKPVLSHAVLARSEPAANARLREPPAEIRLWFTEPLEAQFSGFELRDTQGMMVATAASQVDAADPYQMFMQPGALADGLYTVVWWNVSTADGHHTEGSFPFTIGAPVATETQVSVVEPTIPPGESLVRWLNLFSLALAVGGLGFVLLVWRPLIQVDAPTAERRLRRVIWVGWALVGISGLLVLWLQTAKIANMTVRDALELAVMSSVVTGTRFGTLWLIRMLLWLLMGALLWIAQTRAAFAWAALTCGVAILLLVSLFSHAAAVQDALPSVVSDWVHLLMTALWVGGLVQFLVVIQPLRRTVIPAAPLMGRLAGGFSNYARIAVVGLIVTGLYALWLHVGSLEGLLTTLYGRLLVLKLLLAALLLAVAAVNLIWTHRRLMAGQEIWIGRLRALIGVEIVLLAGVLLVVGAMTSINPARGELAVRAMAAAAPLVPEPQPIAEMQMVDDLHINLTISPGWVGENTFAVTFESMRGQPIGEVSLIRLRFTHQTEDFGESELQITEGEDGVYSVSGANLSAPGDWQIRMTVQRPDQFDAVVDFLPTVEPPPPPPPAPVIDLSPASEQRIQALLITGVLALAVGGFFLGQQRFRFWIKQVISVSLADIRNQPRPDPPDEAA